MSKKLTTEEFIEKAKQLHNDKYDYSQTIYVNSRSDVIVICPEHGVFEQRASSHLAGNGCPQCAKIWSDEHRKNLQQSSRKSRGMTTDEWIARAKSVHGNTYDYSQTVYVNQRTNVKIICSKHGIFEQKADSHIRGNGCRLCGLESENHKGVHKWSDEQKAKTTKTCIERYGAKRYLDSVEGQEKIHKIKSTPEFRNKMREIITSEDVQNKTKQTSLQKYGVESPAQTKEVQAKIYKTKKANHTVNSSKSEQKMYEMLINRFGKDDVIHQYRDDERYPFACDFYIKSLDLFVELNASWTHNNHWFGDCLDDKKVLKSWQQKAQQMHSTYYLAAIQTWTIRDVKKRQTAIENNLNYVVFWKSDLSDFKQWFESDSLILNNLF